MKIYRADIYTAKVTTDVAEDLTERSVVFLFGYKIPRREKDKYEYFDTFEKAKTYLVKYFSREEKRARKRIDIMRLAKKAAQKLTETEE